SLLPKPRRVGGETSGPPVSCQVRRRRGGAEPLATDHLMESLPSEPASDTYLAELVASSYSTMASISYDSGASRTETTTNVMLEPLWVRRGSKMSFRIELRSAASHRVCDS